MSRRKNRTRNAQLVGKETSVTLAASKRARVVRERDEFDLGRLLASMVRAPAEDSGGRFSWSIPEILAARDQQMAGVFYGPKRLSAAFSTDDALFTARRVRLAPVQGLAVKIEPGTGPRADKIADEAEALFGTNGVAFSSETESTVRRHLIDHGVAFASIAWTPRADGTRWDMVVSAWPIEWVRWSPLDRCYVTQAQIIDNDINQILATDQSIDGVWEYNGQAVEPRPDMRVCVEKIIHGGGRWIVFSKSEIMPHQFDATLLAAAMVWACHAFANLDWRKGSASHGNAKVIGEMNENTALTDEDGKPTPEAIAFLQLLVAIASQDQPVGIVPSGAKVNYLVNTSNAWEVWRELSTNAEKAAARLYLGTDGVLGAQGGAPGVDLQALLGVATSEIQSDLACINRCLRSGAMSPWCAINFGDDKGLCSREYEFPDADKSAVRKDFAERNAAFNADVRDYRENGFVVDQTLIDEIAGRHGVPAPRLPASPAASDAPAAVAPAPAA